MKSLATNRVCQLLRSALAVALAVSPVGVAGCGNSDANQSPTDAPVGPIDAGAMPDGNMPQPDGNMPQPDAASPDAAVPDAPVPTMTTIRFVHASALQGAIDIYRQNETTPIVTALAYGATSPQIELTDGSYQFDVRVAGTAATDPAGYTSAAIAVDSSSSTTVVATGFLGSGFQLTGVVDTFTAPAAGKTHVRLMNASFFATLAVDLGDDGTLDIASLASGAMSDAAGIDVPSGKDLTVAVRSTDFNNPRISSFVVPGSALADGADVYLLATGTDAKRLRDPATAMMMTMPAPGKGSVALVQPSPWFYLLEASPDAGAIDGYIGTTKVFTNVAFSKVGTAIIVPPTDTGITLDIRPTGADVSTPALKSFSTGPLATGQQYLGVVSGLAAPTGTADALALTVYPDDLTLALDNSARIRAINVMMGVPAIDVGKFVTGPPKSITSVDGFTGLTTGSASPAGGSLPAMTPNPGIQSAGDASQVLRFALVTPTAVSRVFLVFTGVWTPTGAQQGPHMIVVRSVVGATWSSTNVAGT